MSQFKHPYMAVACPSCGAKVGGWCKRPSGHSGPMVAFHAARRKVAEELEYKPDGIQVQCLKTWYAAGDGSVPSHEQILHAVLGLVGEGGEAADLLKKWLFKPGAVVGREDVMDELADVLYYLAVLAHLWEFTIEDMAAHLAVKLADGHGWKGVPPIVGMREDKE